MSRSVLGLNRLLAFMLGVVLLAGGLTAAAWAAGWLVRVWASAPSTLHLQTVSETLAMPWWPWAAGIAGAVLVLLGLWWLSSHLPRRGVGVLSLPGSDEAGRLTIDPAGAATTAADVLSETAGVRSASGRVLRDRGQVVVALKATVEPTADLRSVVAATDDVAVDLLQVLGRDDVRARVQLGVARRARHQSRVH